ncbi:uncharacterized protein THITE_2116222 [Thermothielavioides terrestris NRRL 8126]|uniref:Uncharacterized protein n=2 Tax=Thermothielavioides terrestris TaxID=2587410 RepID=G2R0S0_THETT|nr:uncharacterized protein THITE_2116222 [Thermothielavioides terrestris NRRL 8126]AEO67331.1 hypothetical protein THITE_2116222 [Thermothielavioides terrestris NRRL 8126]
MLALPEPWAKEGTLEAAVRMILTDLCTGETQDLRAHVDLAREIAGQLGGLSSPGLSGILARLVVV